MRQILSGDLFCVPIFQRRYCWGETQWQTLLDDASKTRTSSSSATTSVAAGIVQQHSLGRLTCTNQTVVRTANSGARQPKSENLLAGVEGRSCILDGQQRFTTVTILLSAIRDLLQEDHKEISPKEVESDWDVKKIQMLISSIDDLLFTNVIQMRAWMYRPDAKLEEGVELPFARLVPTFCDRWSYYSAILPSSSTTVDNVLEASSSSDSSWHRPLAAKRFFLSKLQQDFSSPTQLSNVLTCVLDGLTMLYFPVDVNQGYNDGTEDLMVIYERLALRDATFCKPRREEEYLSMDGVDMIRNLLLGSFREQTDALEFYKDYWLPIEKLTSEQSYGRSIKEVLEAFLDLRREDSLVELLADGKHNHGIIGGKIYVDFQAWLEEATNCSVMSGGNAPEEKVRQVERSCCTLLAL